MNSELDKLKYRINTIVDDVVLALVTHHLKVIDDILAKQLTDILIQALKSGDFQSLITRKENIRATEVQLTYEPYRKVKQLEATQAQLVEALEMARKYERRFVLDHDEEPPREYRKMMAKVNAALAKAEG